jgi:hypothetical protein
LRVFGLSSSGFAPLIELVVGQVLKAELLRGTGAEKKAYVLESLQKIGPEVLKDVGRPVLDLAKYESGLSKLVDGVVDVLNSVGMLLPPKLNK